MGILAAPRQTILVTCRSHATVMGRKVERDNVMALDWHMPASFEPPMYAIAVGKSRFSHRLISEGKCFVVNFVPFEMKDQAVYCGRHSGEHINKFREAGLEAVDAEKVDAPRIAGAMGHIECEVAQEIDAGDHTIFLGKVLHGEIVKEGKRLFHIDGNDFTTTK